MPNKNTKIINPYTDTTCFGVMPEIRNPHFPSGEIFLRHGKHFGPNRGFGVQHIWTEHNREIKELGYETEEDVARYIADILQEGARIYYEGYSLRNERVTIVKSFLGWVLAEHRIDGENNDFYSVITAYKGKVPHGQEIGKLPAVK